MATKFESRRARADVRSAVELAAVIDEVAAHRIDDPAFGNLLQAQRLIIERINRDRRRQAKVGKLGSIWHKDDSLEDSANSKTPA